MKRREFLTVVGGTAAAWPLAAHAQQPLRQPLIAVLSPLSASAAARNIGALRSGLRDLGGIEGKNIRIEVRYADGEPDRLAPLTAELIALNPDVILTGSQGGALAAHNATQTIPIVVAGLLADPVKLGLVKSIARPGGNVTGTWLFADEDALVGKRLELLKLMMPDLSKVGAVLNPADAADIPMLPLMTRSARALRLDLRVYEVRDVFHRRSAAAIMHEAKARAGRFLKQQAKDMLRTSDSSGPLQRTQQDLDQFHDQSGRREWNASEIVILTLRTLP